MQTIIIRGFSLEGGHQKIITRGYGYFLDNIQKEILRLDSLVTRVTSIDGEICLNKSFNSEIINNFILKCEIKKIEEQESILQTSITSGSLIQLEDIL